MHHAGLMDIAIREQHRSMCPELSVMVSRLFYNNELKDGQEGRVRHSISDALVPWNTEKFGIASPLVFLDDPNGHAEKDATNSTYNTSNIMASLALMEDLLADRVIAGKDIFILTPYKSQWMLYIDYLKHLQEERPDLQIADVSAFKTDFFQGREAPVVIVDLVVTTKAGFVGHPNRLNVTLSRARYGMYVVASSRTMDECGAGKWIGRVFGQLRQYQCYDKFRKREFRAEVSPDSLAFRSHFCD